jgi:hypothetical protein
MNKGNGASGLKSYMRQSLLKPKIPSLFIMLDVKSHQRLDVLQWYVSLGGLPDPIALRGKGNMDKKLLQLLESKQPPSLQKWDKWGTPMVSTVYIILCHWLPRRGACLHPFGILPNHSSFSSSALTILRRKGRTRTKSMACQKDGAQTHGLDVVNAIVGFGGHCFGCDGAGC